MFGVRWFLIRSQRYWDVLLYLLCGVWCVWCVCGVHGVCVWCASCGLWCVHGVRGVCVCVVCVHGVRGVCGVYWVWCAWCAWCGRGVCVVCARCVRGVCLVSCDVYVCYHLLIIKSVMPELSSANLIQLIKGLTVIVQHVDNV